MDVLTVVALWLHTVAFVIAWGYYGVLGRIVLPALHGGEEPAVLGPTLASIERRAIPLVAVSGVLFVASGTYLLASSPEYAGLGSFFATTWTTLMLVKHVFVVAFVAAAVVVDASVRRLGTSTNADERRAVARRVRIGAEAATGLGALIALLTAAAQLAP
jgi:uncharacterized membrane protein